MLEVPQHAIRLDVLPTEWGSVTHLFHENRRTGSTGAELPVTAARGETRSRSVPRQVIHASSPFLLLLVARRVQSVRHVGLPLVNRLHQPGVTSRMYCMEERHGMVGRDKKRTSSTVNLNLSFRLKKHYSCSQYWKETMLELFGFFYTHITLDYVEKLLSSCNYQSFDCFKTLPDDSAFHCDRSTTRSF